MDQNKYGYILLIFLMIPIYFVEVYAIYGIDILSHPDYNTTTGCPDNKPKCLIYAETLLCYENHMVKCYALGGVIFLLTYSLLIYLVPCLCPIDKSKITNESQKLKDVLLYPKNYTLSNINQ